MKKRSTILRKCPICNVESMVRKDAVGLFCRKCRAKSNHNKRKITDLSNQKFGRLTVLEFAHKTHKKRYIWECICECGKVSLVDGGKLKSGSTKSCGCLVLKRNGLSQTGTFRSWKAMIQRCYDTKVKHYKRYGKLGIIVCERWLNSFENFLKDMGERPIGLTLDRINSYGNYEPSNCRWSTPSQQANNRKKK